MDDLDRDPAVVFCRILLIIVTIPGVVAVMAIGAGGRIEIAGVTFSASRTLVIDTVAITPTRVGEVEAGRTPGTRTMTLAAWHARKRSRMEWRIGMA